MADKLSFNEFKKLAGIQPSGPSLHEDNHIGDGGGDPSHARAKAVNKAAEPNRDQVMDNPIDKPYPHANSSMPPDVTVHTLKKLAGMVPEVSSGFLDEVRMLANEALESSKAFANRMNMVGRPDPRVERYHIDTVRSAVEHVNAALKSLYDVCKSAHADHQGSGSQGSEYVPVPKPEMLKGADEKAGGRKINTGN